jgi:hypothetical protein
VLKAPYTTNCSYRSFCGTEQKLFDALVSASKIQQSIPYVIVQPCLYNRKEYKVVCFNERAMYICNPSITGRKSKDGICIAFSTPSAIMEFANLAIQEAKANLPYLLCDGLFRVDIMQGGDGFCKVNEFESLEANYEDLGKNQHLTEYKIVHLLTQYWMKKIMECFEELINTAVRRS